MEISQHVTLVKQRSDDKILLLTDRLNIEIKKPVTVSVMFTTDSYFTNNTIIHIVNYFPLYNVCTINTVCSLRKFRFSRCQCVKYWHTIEMNPHLYINSI